MTGCLLCGRLSGDDITYFYDARAALTLLKEGASNRATYLYDDAYQLTSEVRTGGDSYMQTYLYDASGNRTKKTLGGTDTTYLYNTADQLTSETTGGTTTEYEYDANGALTKSDDGTIRSCVEILSLRARGTCGRMCLEGHGAQPSPRFCRGRRRVLPGKNQPATRATHRVAPTRRWAGSDEGRDG